MKPNYNMDKKGAELSMNVIVISILVILVLVVLSYFFLGGTATLFEKIQNVGPDDLDNAKSDCRSKCQFAGSLNINDDSSYCRTTFKVDTNEDGIADEKHHCWSDTVNIDCPGIQEVCEDKYDTVESLSQE